MAYDEQFAARIRGATNGALTERRMFGGLAFLVNGNPAVVAVSHDGLLVRVDPAEAPDVLESTPAQIVLKGGAAMSGWLRVPADALHDDAALADWVARAVAFARSLPPTR